MKNPPDHLREVAEIEGFLSFEEADLLYRLARRVERGCIVEVGVFRGRSTVALALGVQDGHGAPVYALDPHETFAGVFGGAFGPEDRGAFYRTMLRTSCYRTVRLVNLSSEIVTPGWKQPVGLLWIDGDHAYEAVKRDIQCWRPHLVERAHVAFDDSTAPELGPTKVVAELVDEGTFERIATVGKVTVVRKL